MYNYTKRFGMATKQALSYHANGVAGTDLHGGHLPYLMVVSENPGITQEGVAEKMMMDKSTVAKMVKQLVDRGYITRTVDGEDKRAYNLHASGKAKEIYPKIVDGMNRWHEHLLSKMTDVEKLLLAMLLDKLNLA